MFGTTQRDNESKDKFSQEKNIISMNRHSFKKISLDEGFFDCVFKHDICLKVLFVHEIELCQFKSQSIPIRLYY